jgi:NAD(P)-dependent dehydrogenase (short-subunit alcohol dehydrogenase family)
LKTQRRKSVLLIGGLGNLGFQLGLKLQEADHKVTILDLEATIDKYILSSDNSHNRKLTELVFFKEGKFFKPGPPPKIIKDIPKFDTVVICVRTRESQENLLLANPFSTEAIAAMEENFRSTVIEPLTIIEKLISSNSRELLQSSLIFTYSSNANQISHQSMGYHVINSAIQNLVQYLSISLRARNIAVYALELGVIDFKSYSYKENQSSVDFPGTTINEIGDVIEFILNCNPISLVGKSIAMTGGRAFLDATAVAEQVFGDLKVRG